jgi:hypothetical protein
MIEERDEMSMYQGWDSSAGVFAVHMRDAMGYV